MILARAVTRIFLLILLTLFVVGSQTLILPFYRGPASYIIPWLWQSGVRRIFGIRVTVEGKPARDRQTLYISNHLSYLDIPVVGSFVFGAFIARGDLSRWPVFGYMSKMQQTVFISRNPKDAAAAKNMLDDLIQRGTNLIIFAEGTSTDGSAVLPFKSSLFGLALDNASGKPLQVQPVTISLLEADGKSATSSAVRDLYAWHGDMTLPPHIWQAALSKGAHIHVRFHPPRDAGAYTDRKKLCQDCYEDVSRSLIVPGAETAPLARAA